MLSLRDASKQSGQTVIRLGRWCATGQIRCESDGHAWMIRVSELPAIATVAREQEDAVAEKRITAFAVPAPAPRDLAHQVAARLGLTLGQVSVTPFALNDVDYMVAVWHGAMLSAGGLPALQELALELNGDLLDGDVEAN